MEESRFFFVVFLTFHLNKPMSQSDITWKSAFPIGQYKGDTLLSVLVKDKGYLQWCYKKELHLQYA